MGEGYVRGMWGICEGRKEAVLKPLLKKTNLDHTEFKNYRPVSNLSFLSKVIEKAVVLQLISYLEDNHLYEPLQSAARRPRLLKFIMILLLPLTVVTQSVILVLLDLSAAFDTVDHRVLIQRLSTRFGIRSTGLSRICPTARKM